MNTEQAIKVLNNPLNYIGDCLDGELINAIACAIAALRAQQELDKYICMGCGAEFYVKNERKDVDVCPFCWGTDLQNMNDHEPKEGV